MKHNEHGDFVHPPPNATGGDRFNTGKAPVWLIPWAALSPLIDEVDRPAAHALWLWSRRDAYASTALREAVKSEDAVLSAAQILGFGAEKYAAFNWEKGLSFVDTVSSGIRHAIATAENDVESSKPHRFHLLCNVLFAAAFDADPDRYKKFDDRPGRIDGSSEP